MAQARRRPRTAPAIRRLTTEILRLQASAASHLVEALVEIGQKIEAVRERLRPGEWLAWIDEELPFTRRTVANYLTLSRWAEEHPQELDRVRPLGPSKLYLLAALPPEDRKRFTGRRAHPIPGSDARKTVDRMTVAELKDVIDGFRRTPGDPRVPIDTLVRSFRSRIAGLDDMADELVSRRRELDHDDIRDLLAEVAELTETLEAALE